MSDTKDFKIILDPQDYSSKERRFKEELQEKIRESIAQEAKRYFEQGLTQAMTKPPAEISEKLRPYARVAKHLVRGGKESPEDLAKRLMGDEAIGKEKVRTPTDDEGRLIKMINEIVDYYSEIYQSEDVVSLAISYHNYFDIVKVIHRPDTFANPEIVFKHFESFTERQGDFSLELLEFTFETEEEIYTVTVCPTTEVSRYDFKFTGEI